MVDAPVWYNAEEASAWANGYNAAMDEMEANRLPDWDDLRGRAPHATGELSSEAFIRELRDGWR